MFIFADQYRRALLGFLNEDPVNTPNTDKLAEEGVFFSRAISIHRLCSPYRAMLMTGKYPLSNGIIENYHSAHTAYVNLKKEVCFPDVLVQNGYSADYVRKWHLDGLSPTPPGVKRVKGLTIGKAQKLLQSEQVEGSQASLKELKFMDMGLLDLVGRIQNRPAIELLNLAHSKAVPGLYCILHNDEAKVRNEVEKSIEQNLAHHLKFKIYGHYELDLKLPHYQGSARR